MEHALRDAGAGVEGTGAVLGSAFGSVDASAAFMHRLFEKGPRFASPAEFPNLVPSSPAGHVSIYLGLRGPVFATADLSASGESAIAQAAQLVAAGDGDRIVAGAAEEKSTIVERVLVALFARSQATANAPRSEGAAAVVLEAEEVARARGARVLARVAALYEWREGAEGPLATVSAPTDPARAWVVLPRPNGGVDALLAPTPWANVRRVSCGVEAGEHEGLGAIAVSAAVGSLVRGDVAEVLVVGLAKGRGYALVLTNE
jgi:3-oxoacyl-[acyl-carrier-protein] synthase II